jgi:SET domain-containing protein
MKSKILKKQSVDVKIKRTRKGTGLGLVALRPFRKGERIIEYIGILKANKDVEDNETKYLFEINKRYTIDGSPRWNTACYINHACKPNAESVVTKGRVFIDAIKSIAPGEEITYDYGKEYFDEFIKPFGCKCATCVTK